MAFFLDSFALFSFIFLQNPLSFKTVRHDAIFIFSLETTVLLVGILLFARCIFYLKNSSLFKKYTSIVMRYHNKEIFIVSLRKF